MSTETQPLHVEVILPPAPYALASSGFLATLAQVESEIAAMKVATPQDAQAAANIQSRLTTAGSALEKQRKALKEPFLEAGRRIDAAAQAPAARIETAKGAVKRLLTAYDQEQQRIAREAEAKRQEELRQLRLRAEAEERERQRVAAELAKAAAEKERLEREAAAKANVEVMEFDDGEPLPEPPVTKTETERKIEELQHAPAVVAPKPAGVAFKVLLVATVTDVNKLPDCFVTKTAKMAEIRAAYCNGFKDGDPIPVLDGVKFEVSRTPISTGRNVF